MFSARSRHVALGAIGIALAYGTSGAALADDLPQRGAGSALVPPAASPEQLLPSLLLESLRDAKAVRLELSDRGAVSVVPLDDRDAELPCLATAPLNPAPTVPLTFPLQSALTAKPDDLDIELRHSGTLLLGDARIADFQGRLNLTGKTVFAWDLKGEALPQSDLSLPLTLKWRGLALRTAARGSSTLSPEVPAASLAPVDLAYRLDWRPVSLEVDATLAPMSGLLSPQDWTAGMRVENALDLEACDLRQAATLTLGQQFQELSHPIEATLVIDQEFSVGDYVDIVLEYESKGLAEGLIDREMPRLSTVFLRLALTSGPPP